MSGRNMSRGNVLPHVKREEELSGSGDVRGEHVWEEYVQGECPTPCKKGGRNRPGVDMSGGTCLGGICPGGMSYPM